MVHFCIENQTAKIENCGLVLLLNKKKQHISTYIVQPSQLVQAFFSTVSYFGSKMCKKYIFQFLGYLNPRQINKE